MTLEQKQCILAFFGLLVPSGIDGVWGPESSRATRQLQKKLSIPEDGIWGNQTEAAVRRYFCQTPEDTEEGSFWDHIRHWSREEWRCRCGGAYCDGFPAEPDQTLVELVDDIRHKAGAPGHRSSGIRCEIHNQNEGGVWNSRHLYGKALDFYIEGMTGAQLLALAKKDSRTNYAYIIGNGPYVHVDVK